MIRQTSLSSYGEPKKRMPAWLIPAVVLAGIAVPVALAARVHIPGIIDAPRFDRDWCVEGKPADDIVVLFGDQTDRYSPRHLESWSKAYRSLVEQPPSLSVRGRLVVLVMDAKSHAMVRQIDSFCRPL
jgi:hypothetical protein